MMWWTTVAHAEDSTGMSAGIDLKISSGVRDLEPSVVVGSWYALAARQAMCDASVEECSSSDGV